MSGFPLPGPGSPRGRPTLSSPHTRGGSHLLQVPAAWPAPHHSCRRDPRLSLRKPACRRLHPLCSGWAPRPPRWGAQDRGTAVALACPPLRAAPPPRPLPSFKTQRGLKTSDQGPWWGSGGVPPPDFRVILSSMHKGLSVCVLPGRSAAQSCTSARPPRRARLRVRVGPASSAPSHRFHCGWQLRLLPPGCEDQASPSSRRARRKSPPGWFFCAPKQLYGGAVQSYNPPPQRSVQAGLSP